MTPRTIDERKTAAALSTPGPGAELRDRPPRELADRRQSMAPNPRPGQGRLRRRTRGRKRPPLPRPGNRRHHQGAARRGDAQPLRQPRGGPAGGRTRTTTLNRCSVRTKQKDHLLVEQGRRRVTVDDIDAPRQQDLGEPSLYQTRGGPNRRNRRKLYLSEKTVKTNITHMLESSTSATESTPSSSPTRPASRADRKCAPEYPTW